MSVVSDPFVSEIFLVDDGSNDNSFFVSQQLASKYEIANVLHHPNHENMGAAATRNLGLANAKSEWIQFLDADDEILKGKLKGQIEIINSNIAFIVGNSIHIFPDSRKHFRKSDKEIWKGLIRSKLGDTCSNLWNKKYLLMVGGWDEDLSSSQEYDLMFRLLTIHPIVVFDKRYLTLIHKTKNSISTLSDRNYQRSNNWLYLRNKIRKHLLENKQFNLFNKYYWSGAVGIFCDQNQINFPIQVNKWFYNLYKLEISIKIKIFNQLKLN